MGTEFFSSCECGRPAVSTVIGCTGREIRSGGDGRRLGCGRSTGYDVARSSGGIFRFGRSETEDTRVDFDLSSLREVGDFIDVAPMGGEVVHEQEILYLFELDGQ